MKRFFALALLLLVSMSCGPKKGTEPGNLDITRADFKRVTIVLSETSGGIVMEGPIPDEAVFPSGRKIKWTVINNTSKNIESVMINGFYDSTGDTAPFEGTSADQEFPFGVIIDGEEAEKFSTKLKNLSPGVTRNYKYVVTVKMQNVGTPIKKDPRIIVSG